MMNAINVIPLSNRRMQAIAVLVTAAGAVGMGISYVYLASAHPLDALAGAAGFIAGAILLSAGMLAATWLITPSLVVPEEARGPTEGTAFAIPDQA